MPDAAGSLRRYESFAPVARAAGLTTLLEEWKKALAPLRDEIDAQQALRKVPGPVDSWHADSRKAYLEVHGSTQTGKLLAPP